MAVNESVLHQSSTESRGPDWDWRESDRQNQTVWVGKSTAPAGLNLHLTATPLVTGFNLASSNNWKQTLTCPFSEMWLHVGATKIPHEDKCDWSACSVLCSPKFYRCLWTMKTPWESWRKPHASHSHHKPLLSTSAALWNEWGKNPVNSSL